MAGHRYEAPGAQPAFLNVRNFGAVGNYNAATDLGHDDTAAFQRAVNKIALYPVDARPALYIGLTGGDAYLVAAPLTGVPENFAVVGATKEGSRICFKGAAVGSGVMFDLGTFDTNPPSLYIDTNSGFSMANLQIDIPGTSYANEGARIGMCVRDNGNGSCTFTNTKIAGFAYGFQGPYGSDFDRFENADFMYNDVGAYMGPGSQQSTWTGGQFFGNREGLVVERACHGTIVGTAFIDSKVSDITFVHTAASTRTGVNAAQGLQYSFLHWKIINPWHESAASGATRIPPQHILTTGDTNGYPQYVRVQDAFLVSGGTPSASNAYWRNDQGTRHILDGLLIYGGQIKYAFSGGTTSPRITMRNVRQTDGSGGNVVALWDPGSIGVGQTYEEPITQSWKFGRLVSHPVDGARVVGDTQARHLLLADGTHQWGSGAAAVDLSAGRGGVGFGYWPVLLKAGVPADGDFVAAPPNGTMAVNTAGAAGSRIYFRVAGVWTAIA